MMLDKIVAEGEPALDRFLKSDADREVLFRRFSAYRPFAEGYRCPLDTNAELAEERVAELAPERAIRFIRLNSALVCSKNDEEGKLLLGARQRVLTERPGEELVVLSHHPVHWFQDSEDALLFIRNRARVFISGHEHVPSVKKEKIDEGRDLMTLAAGAAVPPSTDRTYTYCYNFIEFEWDSGADALSVRIWPRVWVNGEKRFGADSEQDGDGEQRIILACPNFRNAPRARDLRKQEQLVDGASDTVTIAVARDEGGNGREETVADTYSLLLLRFFRDSLSNEEPLMNL